MLYHFIFPLYEAFGFFNIFRYISFRAIIAALLGMVLTIILGRYYIKKSGGKVYSIKHFIPKNHQKKSHVPNIGGLIILVSVLIAIFFTGNFNNYNTWILIIGFIAFSLLGYCDDRSKKIGGKGLGIKAKKKFIYQIAISITLVTFIYLQSSPIVLLEEFNTSYPFTVVFIPFTKNFSIDLNFLFWGFAVFILVASSNAVNLTDGLDGLAVGLSLFVLLTFIIIAYVSGNVIISEYLKIPYLSESGEMTVFLAALVGSCLGFLWYNSHPAQIFMGDTGSLALGGVLGLSAIMLKSELLLPIIGGIFVIEAMSVIIQVLVFKTWGKRFFKMAPLHHHFEIIGWHENKIISRFWIIGILLSLIALATLKIR